MILAAREIGLHSEIYALGPPLPVRHVSVEAFFGLCGNAADIGTNCSRFLAGMGRF